MEGLLLEGAQFSNNSIQLSDQLKCKLPLSQLKWRLKTSRSAGDNVVLFPLYLNDSRTSLVAEVLLSVPKGVPAHVWAQRGVAIVMQATLY